ncbi:MAG: hypothetical protein AAFZ58_00605 [Pseudomonadota bacterium]
MNAEIKQNPTPSLLKSRLQLLALAAVFIGPFAAAALMFHSGGWRPPGTTNNGELLNPPVQLPAGPLASTTGVLQDALRGQWRILYLERGECGDTCRDTLIQIRQVRLATGRDIDRVARLFFGNDIPDEDWFAASQAGLVAAQIGYNTELAETLAAFDTGLYLIDPAGQLMMRYAIGTESKEIYDDLHKLLKQTR